MNPIFSLRPASIDDLEKIVSIENVQERFPWSLDAFKAELNKTGSLFWVLTDDETDELLVGYLVAHDDPDANALHLIHLATHPKWVRLGLAKRLLRALIQQQHRLHRESLRLEVRADNSAALALYSSFDFLEVRKQKSFYSDGCDAIFMERSRGSEEESSDSNDDGEQESMDEAAGPSDNDTDHTIH